MIFIAFLFISVLSYEPYYLCAPFTSFGPDFTVNTSNIPLQAKFCSENGVNLVWINGGLGQFETLTLDERKTIAEIWVKEAQKYGIETLIHITDLNVQNSNMLAKHAQEIGADYVATLPPFYEHPSSVENLIDWIKAITEGVDLGIFYYHIPGSTNYQLNIYDLVKAADEELGGRFRGVKFVDSHDKIWDFEKCLTYKNGKYAKGMMWALEPKLMAFPFGARSIILAEAYYAKYYKKMTELWDNGEIEKAYELQKYIQEIHEIINIGGNKNVFRGFGFDLGPDRLPKVRESEEKIKEMLDKLDKKGFFD